MESLRRFEFYHKNNPTHCRAAATILVEERKAYIEAQRPITPLFNNGIGTKEFYLSKFIQGHGIKQIQFSRMSRFRK